MFLRIGKSESFEPVEGFLFVGLDRFFVDGDVNIVTEGGMLDHVLIGAIRKCF